MSRDRFDDLASAGTRRVSASAPTLVGRDAYDSQWVKASALHSVSIDALIDEYASRYRVRVGLVRAVIRAESAFNPRALSRKGAMGLMQLMPATAEHFGVTDAFNPSENIRAGVAYLRHLLDRYHGDERLAVAAYNAGPTAVDRFGRTTPPFPETISHAARTLGSAEAATVLAAVVPEPLPTDGQ